MTSRTIPRRALTGGAKLPLVQIVEMRLPFGTRAMLDREGISKDDVVAARFSGLDPEELTADDEYTIRHGDVVVREDHGFSLSMCRNSRRSSINRSTRATTSRKRSRDNHWLLGSERFDRLTSSQDVWSAADRSAMRRSWASRIGVRHRSPRLRRRRYRVRVRPTDQDNGRRVTRPRPDVVLKGIAAGRN